MRLQLRTGNDRGKVNAKVMARSGTRFFDETSEKIARRMFKFIKCSEMSREQNEACEKD